MLWMTQVGNMIHLVRLAKIQTTIFFFDFSSIRQLSNELFAKSTLRRCKERVS